MRGLPALLMLRAEYDFRTVLDVGCGAREQSKAFEAAGKEVWGIDLRPQPTDPREGLRVIRGDFLTYAWGAGREPRRFDAVWACHVLEHSPAPGLFLRRCFDLLAPGGVLAVTVPPAKHEIVGGHVTLWNAGLLLYHLILAGFDCRAARVHAEGYDISVLVRKVPAALPELRHDEGDIEALAPFFPVPVHQGFDGRLTRVNW